jgi:hypothetical protein
MDITRNWRLKTSRSQLIATRCPITGEIVLPQQNGVAALDAERYSFEVEAPQPAILEGQVDYARAAR